MKNWEKKIYDTIHETKIVLPKEDNPSLVPPLYDSVKYSFESSKEITKLFSGEREGYLYSRVKNPNTQHLANLLSKIMGRSHTLLTPNGVSAITLCLDALSYPNACVLFFKECYAPTKKYISVQLQKHGVEALSCNIDNHDEIFKIFEQHSPDILIFESPTNPQLKVADLNFLLNLCKKHECISILDNTFASLHQHNDYPIDVIIHSLTKYASGHSDIMGGSLSFHNEDLYKEVKNLAQMRGLNMEASIAKAFIKALQTYPMRYKTYAANSLELAKMLEKSKLFPQVIHPGLRSHPEHSLALEQQISPGNVIYLELPESKDFFEFIDSLERIILSPSLGSNETLVAPAKLFYGDGHSEKELQSMNISDQMLRFSIGLDSPEVLYQDIIAALRSHS